jgi:hypothetical protein
VPLRGSESATGESLSPCRDAVFHTEAEGGLVRNRAVVAILAVSALAGAGRADADEGAGLPVMVGSRVRISAPSLVKGDHIQGVIAAIDGDSATVSTESGVPVVVAREAVGSFEVSIGRKRNTLKGAAIGAVVGAALGFAMHVDPQNCGMNSPNACSRGEAIGIGTLGGAAWGAIIGAFVKSDRWVHVPLERWRVDIRPVRGGGRASMSFSF